MVSWELAITFHSLSSLRVLRVWEDVPESSAPYLPSVFWFLGKLGPDSCPASHLDRQMAQGRCGVNFWALSLSLRSSPGLALGETSERLPSGPRGRASAGNVLE